MSVLGDKIKELRISHNLYQPKLAEILKISPSMLGMIEQGRRNASDEVKFKLCQYFNVSMDYLMGLTDYSNPVETIEKELKKLNLTSKQYDELMNTWLTEKSIDINKAFFDKPNKVLMDIYLNYLSKKPIKENDSIRKMQKNTEKVDSYFINMLKNVRKDKVLPKENLVYFSDRQDIENELKISTTSIPILGQVKAGYDYLAQENWEGTINVEKSLVGNGKEYFALKVKGDSMSPMFIEGDIVIVKKQDDCENNETAIVLINGDEGTIKKVRKTEQGIILQPLNSAYEPIIFTNNEIKTIPIRIIGVVKQLKRNL